MPGSRRMAEYLEPWARYQNTRRPLSFPQRIRGLEQSQVPREPTMPSITTILEAVIRLPGAAEPLGHSVGKDARSHLGCALSGGQSVSDFAR